MAVQRSDVLSGLAAGGALLLAMVAVQLIAPPSSRAAAPGTSGAGVPTQVTDATGRQVPVGDYRRIASASFVADGVLGDLIPANRRVMVTEAHRRTHPEAFRTAHAATLPYQAVLEHILPHDPDLILISDTAGDPSMIARARELGYTVFDLGPMQGRRTLVKNIRRLGQLLGVPERGERVAATLADRLDRLPTAIPPAERLPALYAAAYDSRIYGGTVGSSYHDVLTAAGLIDVAAGAFSGQAWPQLRVEDLLRLEPAIIVTMQGGAESLRALPGVADLDLRIVEVDGALLGDPSLMLPAAEVLQRAVYGAPEPVAEE